MDALPQPTNGRKLARRREELGISQKALADALGINRVTLHHWEKDRPLDAIRTARYERALVAEYEKSTGVAA